MKPRYVKGKDGKFAGSIPNLPAPPQTRPDLTAMSRLLAKRQELTETPETDTTPETTPTPTLETVPVNEQPWGQRTGWVASNPPYEQLQAATDPRTPGELLTLLVDSSDYQVRLAAIENPNLPRAILLSFCHPHADATTESFRAAVRNPSLPEERVFLLATDPKTATRAAVLERETLSEEVVAGLLSQQDRRVFRHPSCPPQYLWDALMGGDALNDVYEPYALPDMDGSSTATVGVTDVSNPLPFGDAVEPHPAAGAVPGRHTPKGWSANTRDLFVEWRSTVNVLQPA